MKYKFIFDPVFIVICSVKELDTVNFEGNPEKYISMNV